MDGTILNIARFCTDDGPGIRTVVFLKGCPLSCKWCHNPESQSKDIQIAFDAEKCTNCAKCVSSCSYRCHTFENRKHIFDRTDCTVCGSCAQNCPAGALRVYGEKVTSADVFDILVRDSAFYEASGGGVTISGGEPLFQPEFTSDILKRCKSKGIHTAIETSGYASRDVFISTVSNADMILFDIKETDSILHEKYTGVPLEPIMENLMLTSELGIPVILRVPIIPGYNDDETHFKKLKELSKSVKCCLSVEVMPYHSLGIHKYSSLGLDYMCKDVKEPDTAQVEKWRAYLKAKTD